MPNDERPSSSTASATPPTSTAPGRARSPIRIGLAPYGSLTGRRLSNESLPKRPQFDSPPPARDSPHSRRDGQGSSTSHRHSRYDDRPAHYDDRRRSPPPSHRRSPSPRRRSPPPSSSHRRRSPSPRPYGASSSSYSSSAPSHRPSNGHASNGRSSRYDDPPSSTASSSRRTSVTASDKPSAPSTSSSRPPAPEPPSSRPPPPPTSRPPPPPSTAPSSRPYTTRPSSAFDKLPAFFYKPLGAKDFRVTYDPTLDPNPIKKGKEVVQRFDGEGLTESTKDPRRPEDAEEKAKIEKRMQRGPYMKKLAVVTYSWDKNSTGPPPPAPPSAVLVTGFPSTTTADALHAHFRSYGRIETQDVKYDSQTGGSLGICWIKFVDDVPRDAEPDKPTREKYERKRRSGQAQDGGAIALQAVEKANGAKVGMAMLMGDVGVTVVLDADGVKCKAAVKAEMDKRHPPKTEKKPLPPPSSSSRAPPLPSSAPPAPPSQPPPPPPPTTAPPPPPPRLPLPPQTSLYAPPPRSSRFGAVPGLPATPLPAAPSGPRFSGQAAPTGSRGAARGAPPMGPSSMSGGGGGATPSSVTRDAAPHLSLPTKPVPLVVPTISRAEVATHVSVPSMVIPPLPPRRPVTTSSSSSTSAPAKSAPVSLLPKPPARAGLPSNPLSHNSRFGAPSSRERGGRGGGRHGGPLRADSMASAIAQAVEAAKRRLKKSQSARTAEEEEADMELDSEEEGASKSGAGGSESEEEEEGEEEEDKKDAVFYHRTSGRPQSRTILPRGIAPVGAIAWQASKKVLLEKLAANGKQYLKIDKTRFQEKRDGQGGRSAVPNAEELEKHFGKYEIDRTFADSEGWYITFKESSAAKEALEALSGKKLGGAPLEFLLEDPPTIVPPSTAVTPATTSAAAKPNSRNSKAPEPGSHLAALVEKLTRRPTPVKAKKTSGWTDAELVEEAKEIVIADLLEAFTNDIRTRLVRGKVQEHLQALDQQERRGVKAEPSPSVTPAPLPFANHVKPEPGRESPLLNGSAPLPSTSASTAASTSAAPKSLSALSFAKRKSTNYSQQDDRHRRRGSTSTRRSSEGPSDSPAPGFGHHSSDDDSYARRRGKNGSKKSSSSKSKSSKARAAFSDSEESSADERVRRRKSDSGKSRSKKAAAEGKRSSRPSVDYTSSEGEDEEEEPKKLARVKEEEDDSNSTVTASASVAPPSPAGSGSPELVDFSAFRRPKKPVDVDEEDDDGMDVDEDDSPAPVKVKGKLVRGRRPSLVVGKVEEFDEEIERKPKQEIRVPTSYEPFEAGLAGDEEDLYYLKLALERLQLGQDLHPTPPPSDDEGAASQKHASGSARTEGFYKITIEEKMANRPASNKAKAAETAKATAAAGTSSVAVSRLARANTRGLVRGMELHKKVTATDTDVLKFNQLKTRKKQLTFSRSGIEGYGLFAVEFIPAGDMVIEYVGELIRQQVADRREKAYERQGIGSSYLFRLDEDLVVDATKKGNLGRLINHCCAPNCTARIITINGVKKIVIYAKTNILPGHEVTYDYHFPIEENKVACLCGHPQCRGTLN